MHRAHNFIVLPAVAIDIFPLSIFIHHRTMPIIKGGFHLRHEL
jgi:hypothetical protein